MNVHHLTVPVTFAIVIGVSAIAGTLCALAGRRGLVIPVAVLELVAGVLIGPQVAGVAIDSTLLYMSQFGLGLLFLLAGYEIDPQEVSGRPLRLASIGWLFSLGIAYAAGAVLVAAGVVLSFLYTGSALATTALGMIVPVLTDGGELRSRFAVNALACGAVGEFGPILLMTLFLSAEGTLHELVLLAAFIVVAGVVGSVIGLFTRRSRTLLESTVEHSSQLAIRWILALTLALALFAHELGLELVLGAFIAGLLTRRAAGGPLPPAIHSKLNGIAYGVFIPFFFVESGMSLDVAALFGSFADVARLIGFFLLMLIVRGVPALALYRSDLTAVDRRSLALMSATQLPVVIAITALATETGHMKPSNAASLVGAAALTAIFFPTLAARLRRSVAVATA